MNKSAKKLAECISLAKGKPPAQMPYYGEGAEPYLNPEYLRGNASAELAKPAVNSVRVQDDDAVLLWDGSNAGEFFKGRKGLLASTMSRISHGDEFDREYFYYAVKRWEPFIKGQTSGSGIPHVDKEILGNLEILCLEPEEQTQIASILSTLDRAIEQTEAIIAKQQRIKAGLMQDLLTKGIDEHGIIRSETTHQFKDSPLGRIPVEWEVSPAHSLCTAVIDCKNRTPPESKDGHPVIRTPNVRGGKFVPADLAMTDTKSYEIWTARGKPQPGDVAITREAPFGEACLIPENIVAPCLGQRMMMYQTDPQKLRSDFMVFAIYSERVQKRLMELAGGSTVGHIRVGDIRNLSIPHPKDVDEQEKIFMTLASIEQAITTLINNVNNLRLTKTGLMHDLLTGTVRVGDTINLMEKIII